MLSLTRKNGERVRLKVGDVIIWIKVLDVDGRKARLGIEAPPSVAIAREEVLVPDGRPRTPPPEAQDIKRGEG